MAHISDVWVVSGNATDTSCPEGFRRIFKDLNSDAGGQWIYLCYREDSGPPITGLVILAQNDHYERLIPGYTRIDIDLNDGADGKYIYLYYTKIVAVGPPITDLTVIITDDEYDVNIPPNWNIIWQDLNEDAGGDYVYLCYKTQSDQHVV